MAGQIAMAKIIKEILGAAGNIFCYYYCLISTSLYDTNIILLLLLIFPGMLPEIPDVTGVMPPPDKLKNKVLLKVFQRFPSLPFNLSYTDGENSYLFIFFASIFLALSLSLSLIV